MKKRVMHNRRLRMSGVSRKKGGFWKHLKLAPFIIIGLIIGLLYLFRDTLADNSIEIVATVAGFALTIVLFHTMYIAIILAIILVLIVAAFVFIWKKK